MKQTSPGFNKDWQEVGAPQRLDESLADEFIGKVVLVGVTYLNAKGEIVGRKQWAGTIKTYSNKEGIQVKVFDSDETCTLPPMASAIEVAKPAIYRLKSTGRMVEKPDYLASYTCTAPKPGTIPNREQSGSEPSAPASA